jgi:hypothetical protein
MNESLKNWEGGGWVRVDFARQLEQERDEAREAFVIATDQMVIAQGKVREANKERDETREKYDNLATENMLAVNKLCNERDEAREKAERYRLEANAFMMQRDALVQKLDAWQEIAEHLHHLVQHPAYGVDQAIRRLDVLAAYKHLNNEH